MITLQRYKVYTTRPWKHAFVVCWKGRVIAASPAVWFTVGWPIGRVKTKAKQYGFSFMEVGAPGTHGIRNFTVCPCYISKI